MSLYYASLNSAIRVSPWKLVYLFWRWRAGCARSIVPERLVRKEIA